MARTHAWAQRCLASIVGFPPWSRRRSRAGTVRWCRAPTTRICAGRPAADWRASSTSRARVRRLRHRRRTGEAEPGHHRRLVHRGTSRRQAPAPVGHQRARRPVRRDRRRADTFDCVSPSRWRATPRCTHRRGRYNITGARYRRDFTPDRRQNATAIPARTTPAPISTTCSRPKRSWRRRCAPFTTSGSSSPSSTVSVTPSVPVHLPS